jgi:hypothetical protein
MKKKLSVQTILILQKTIKEIIKIQNLVNKRNGKILFIQEHKKIF